tara:strand:- start:1341 stop:1511 length:171 start_codon:yes stop_codon:yes gene_type:complete
MLTFISDLLASLFIEMGRAVSEKISPFTIDNKDNNNRWSNIYLDKKYLYSNFILKC